jgi:hypothetical protein
MKRSVSNWAKAGISLAAVLLLAPIRVASAQDLDGLLRVLGGGPSAQATNDDAGTIHACVNDKSGAIKIVNAPEDCQQGEHSLSWNISGAQGPAGPEGPAGPSGPAGEPGADGTCDPEQCGGEPQPPSANCQCTFSSMGYTLPKSARPASQVIPRRVAGRGPSRECVANPAEATPFLVDQTRPRGGPHDFGALRPSSP